VLLQRGANGEFTRSSEGDAMLAVITKYTGQQIEQLRIGLSVVDPALDTADIARQVAWFKRQRMIDADVDATKIVDKSFEPDRPTNSK
jgi:NitT/TauT family transport system substrate-binding protein